MLLWAAGLPLALFLEAVSPLPPLPADAERLFPDGELEVGEEIAEALKSSIMMVYAADALLMAFALKLRVAAAAAGIEGASAGAGGGDGARLPGSMGFGGSVMGHGGSSWGAAYVSQATGFLGRCMPMYVMQPGSGRPKLKVSVQGTVCDSVCEGMPVCCW